VKVFISWSGAVSRDVASALRDWLPCIIQAVQPYVSSEDIDPGVRWSGNIADQLDDTDFGILCLTRDNVTSPWLNFEAGALSKSVDRSRVVPFLVDLHPSDIPRGPLAQFQAVQPTKADVFRLVRAMNDWCSALPTERLQETVDVWWPNLEQRLHDIQQSAQLAPNAGPQRSTSDMLAELLELTRGLQRELQTARNVRPISRSTLLSNPFEYEQELVQAISRLALTKGLQLTELAPGHGPADLKLERGDRMLYVEITVSKDLVQRARETLIRMDSRGISASLLVISPHLVTLSLFDRLESGVQLMQWEGSKDNDRLSVALDELIDG
jgi:TIR domain